MVIYIEIFRIIFRVVLPYPVEIETSFGKFVLPGTPERWDAEIEFIRGCDAVQEPDAAPLSVDDQMIFYDQSTQVLCVARGGHYGPAAYTFCDPQSSRLVCRLNTGSYPPPKSLGALMQLVPLKWFLSRKGVLLLHAAQILTGAKGILFTAPSGTGKTTQSRLWEKHRGAEIVCNDRVLVRGLLTCGFPYDGADPVCNPEEHGLDAIVFLGQSPRNTITRLRPAAAIAHLMQTALFDAWDPQVQRFAAEQLLQIVSAVPVYQLNCTPDEAAVRCLEEQLRKDGVIQ